ncbi:MAG: hypothetical protein HZLCBSQH_000407 [Candidatus Fervidibacterota bacterium]
MATFALAGIFGGLGIVAEQGLRLSGKRVEFARHAIAEVRQFAPIRRI